jgi:hypothetical protein
MGTVALDAQSGSGVITPHREGRPARDEGQLGGSGCAELVRHPSTSPKSVAHWEQPVDPAACVASVGLATL